MAREFRRSDDYAPAQGRIPVRLVLAAGGLFLLLILGLLFAWTVEGNLLSGDAIARRIEALESWGPAAVVVLMVVHCFVPFPAELLALAAGAAYGAFAGTALIWVGAMLGASLSFGLSRWLGRPFVEAMLSDRARASLAGWSADQGALSLLVSRLIPVIAFNLINYAAGLTRVGWWTFLWTTAIGIVPITAATAWFGSRMGALSWPWLLAVSGAGIIAIALGHRWLRRRR